MCGGFLQAIALFYLQLHWAAALYSLRVQLFEESIYSLANQTALSADGTNARYALC